MIDYNELDKYYTGITIRVISNCGGMLLEFGYDEPTLFYKLDDDHYVNVNTLNIAQVMRKSTQFKLDSKTNEVIREETLLPVKNKSDIQKGSSLIKRLKFDPSNYKKNN